MGTLSTGSKIFVWCSVNYQKGVHCMKTCYLWNGEKAPVFFSENSTDSQTKCKFSRLTSFSPLCLLYVTVKAYLLATCSLQQFHILTPKDTWKEMSQAIHNTDDKRWGKPRVTQNNVLSWASAHEQKTTGPRTVFDSNLCPCFFQKANIRQ